MAGQGRAGRQVVLVISAWSPHCDLCLVTPRVPPTPSLSLACASHTLSAPPAVSLSYPARPSHVHALHPPHVCMPCTPLTCACPAPPSCVHVHHVGRYEGGLFAEPGAVLPPTVAAAGTTTHTPPPAQGGSSSSSAPLGVHASSSGSSSSSRLPAAAVLPRMPLALAYLSSQRSYVAVAALARCLGYCCREAGGCLGGAGVCLGEGRCKGCV